MKYECLLKIFFGFSEVNFLKMTIFGRNILPQLYDKLILLKKVVLAVKKLFIIINNIMGCLTLKIIKLPGRTAQ